MPKPKNITGETLAVNFEWLFTVVSVMAAGKIDKNGKIELWRFMQALRVLKSDLTPAEIHEVGGVLNAFDENNKNTLYYYDFLAPIKQILAPPVLEAPDKIEEVKSSKELPPVPASPERKAVAAAAGVTASPPPEESKAAAASVVQTPSPQKEPAEGEELPPPEVELQLPELNEAWSEGDFTLVINRCHDCHFHECYSRHSEEV